MTDKARILARYQHMRQVGMKVNHTLVERLSRDVLEEGGKKLGILRKGALVLDTEDMISVLMDFCIYDVRRHGRNAIEQFLAETPYRSGSDEALYLESLKDAYYSLFVVEDREPGFSAQVRDMIRDESRQIIDVGLSQTAEPGFVLASRIIAPEGIAQTGGAALFVGTLPKRGWAHPVLEFAETAKSLLASASTPEEISEVNGTLIRTCLEAGGADRTRYGEPGEVPGPSPRQAEFPTPTRNPTEDIPPYGPCPCGSGKKYKFCCRARR